jgi:hypothetical protein
MLRIRNVNVCERSDSRLHIFALADEGRPIPFLHQPYTLRLWFWRRAPFLRLREASLATPIREASAIRIVGNSNWTQFQKADCGFGQQGRMQSQHLEPCIAQLSNRINPRLWTRTASGSYWYSDTCVAYVGTGSSPAKGGISDATQSRL